MDGMQSLWTMVTWQCGQCGVVGDGSDVVLMVHVVIVIEQPLVGSNGHSQGQTTTTVMAAVMVAVGEGGGRWKGWCVAMFGNRWLPNIPIIINHYLNY